MICCDKCFANRDFKALVQGKSQTLGSCPSCGSRAAHIVEVRDLANEFSELVSNYQQDSNGEPLLDVLQQDWRLFSYRVRGTPVARRIVEQAANYGWDDDSGEDPIRADQGYVNAYEDVRICWRGLVDATNEWYREQPRPAEDGLPESPLTDERAEALWEDNPWPYAFDEDLGYCESLLHPRATLFRARVGFEEERDGTRVPYRDMGAPSSHKALPGRLNRARERILYCADDEETAVYEVRPAENFLVSVGIVRMSREVRILDLVKGLDFSMFGESAGYFLRISQLLTDLSDDLSTPLERRDSPEDYLPTQIFRHQIQSFGFDGIRYRSAMNQAGTNVAIFDPEMARIESSYLIKVNAVAYSFRRQR